MFMKYHRLIIAGSRDITDPMHIYSALELFELDCDVVVSGGARGVDTLGEQWAALWHKAVHLFPANWSKYGKTAGPKRNHDMALNADALLLIWDGKSKGSANMKAQALARSLPVFELIVTDC